MKSMRMPGASGNCSAWTRRACSLMPCSRAARKSSAFVSRPSRAGDDPVVTERDPDRRLHRALRHPSSYRREAADALYDELDQSGLAQPVERVGAQAKRPCDALELPSVASAIDRQQQRPSESIESFVVAFEEIQSEFRDRRGDQEFRRRHAEEQKQSGQRLCAARMTVR